jgi:hypothetical protein
MIFLEESLVIDRNYSPEKEKPQNWGSSFRILALSALLVRSPAATTVSA